VRLRGCYWNALVAAARASSAR